MNNETLMNGLQNDRYLKAVRLVEDFEDAVFEALGETLDEIMTGAEASLFDQDAGKDRGRYRNPGATYGTLRVEGTMNKTDGDGNNLALNIGLEWVEPESQGISESSDPLLCYVLYKIKYAPKQPFETVAENTQTGDNWQQLRVGNELWDSGDRVAPGIFFVPVSDGSHISDHLDILKTHFNTFAQQLIE